MSGDRPVYLSKVLFLGNQSIETADGKRWEIDGEHVSVQTPDPEHDRRTRDVGDIAVPGEYLDVDLKFALVEGKFAVYWRETYQHRMYRQGLLKIDGEDLVKLCEGEGGISSED
jgi:hypothetical protein